MSLRRFYLLGFVVLIAFDTLSQICFKMAAIHAAPFAVEFAWLLRVLGNPWVYGSIIGYVGAFATWMTLLRHAPVGPAFAASHLEVIGIMIISVPMFGERLGALQLIGAALIVAGVVCLACGERSDASVHS
ncbi:EamA family transporter [Azoarcus sp. DN11]|uniref:DMT family transporter n=1 Tax=Azoarcus sp. DN11 TaxID=356837 RepID=UPI000EB28C07|nr:EamA family transporter [Azoarcus sp. DN11]AYH43876.1 EamA family transporter [Azoarcus sp. DN11]